MKRLLAAATLTATLVSTGCDQGPAQEAVSANGTPAEMSQSMAPETAPSVARPSSEVPAPAAAGAPSFAVVYPGGSASGPATVAQGPDGPGGILSFTTDATPDTVVTFYRQRAEAAGLASVMAMNQGDARAYGAAAEDGSGKLLRVVATPVEDGPTSVQLDWTAGG